MKKSVLVVSACFAVFSLTANELSLSNINRVKVPRAQKIMNKMDKDNDGRISKQEAKGRLKKHFGKIDTNNDGFLTFDELRNKKKMKRKRKLRP